MRRVLGYVMISVGIAGIVLSIVGAIVLRNLVDSIGDGLQQNLTLTVESLDTVRETLILAKTTVGQINEAMDTIDDTTANLSQAIDDTRPLLEQIGTVTSEDVPASLEAVQEATPALVEVADAIDRTLRILNAFRVDESFLGLPLQFDLGVDYDPDVPFDESVQALGDSLTGVPEQLRSLQGYLDVADDNLRMIGENVSDIGSNLSELNGSVAELDPLLEEYIGLVTELTDSSRQTRSVLTQQIEQVKWGFTIMMIWLGLSQVAPLYLGWELVWGGREE